MSTQRVGNGSARLARRTSAVATACGLALLAAQAATPAFAGPTEQAERIYERLAGVQPSPAVLAQMVTAITNQPGQAGLLAAAAIATDPKTAPTFYNVVLKNMVMPWTNRNQTVFVPFNDYAATVIGMVRDNVPFNTALSADILYTVNSSGLPAVSPANNNHYATAETNGVDMRSTPRSLVADRAVGGLRICRSTATAGVIISLWRRRLRSSSTARTARCSGSP